MEHYWSVVEPAYEFIDNWHIGAICEHLEAVTSGEIRNLCITQPPGTMKSLTAGVFWPSWEWTWQPWIKWLFGSYNQDLAVRDSKRTRNLIESEQYLAENGDTFHLLHDTNRQDLFANDRSGFRKAVGVGGGHGQRIDRAIADDPYDPLKAETDSIIEDTNQWWFEVVPNRAQDLKTMTKVIVMQRLTTRDLVAEVLKRELGYEHLNLPMRFESKYVMKPTKIGFVDPRTVDGELLFPQRMPEQAVKELEKNAGVYGTAAQLQQHPLPRGGDRQLFSRPWFERNIRKAAPTGLTLVRYWDKAFTSGGGAYTVGVLMGRTKDGDYWILDVKRGQWGNEITPEQHAEARQRGERPMGHRDRQILECAKEDKAKYGRVKVWLEHEPGAMGRDSCNVLIKLLEGFTVEGDPVREDKTTRAESYSSQQLAGNVYLVEAPWNEPFMQEHTAFPNNDFKDQVDAGSGAFNKLALNRKRDWSPVARPRVQAAAVDSAEVSES